MSHFCVLVIGDDVENQLAPYQENNMGDCPREFLEFNDQEDEYRREYEEEGTDLVVLPDGRKVYPWNEMFRVPGTIGTGSSTHKVPEHLKEVKIPFKDQYQSFEEFVRSWHGRDSRDEQMGRYGYWENPQAKWDWYEVGGRYTGRLLLKSGSEGVVGRPGILTDPAEPGFVDQARFEDIDWEGMKQKRFADRQKWWAEYEQELLRASNDADRAWAAMEAGVEKGQTKEQYLAEAEDFSCFAVVKDGKWYERGNMGWWAVVSNEKDAATWKGQIKELLTDLPADTLLTIVDCHI